MNHAAAVSSPEARLPTAKQAKPPKPASKPRPVLVDRGRGEPYTPGRFDALLAVREHAAPEEIRGVTIEVSRSGTSLIATELLASGATPRHIIRESPYFIDIKLPNSTRSIQIEVREFDDAEDEDNLVRQSAPRFTPASLILFGECDEGDE